ncbi:hypothetical protein [Pseudomonas sp.]|uniref:hypothetical protein n=1 Tax=Pseudomonas sp. TaxID=306 RepID=UPI0033400AA5
MLLPHLKDGLIALVRAPVGITGARTSQTRRRPKHVKRVWPSTASKPWSVPCR